MTIERSNEILDGAFASVSFIRDAKDGDEFDSETRKYVDARNYYIEKYGTNFEEPDGMVKNEIEKRGRKPEEFGL